MGWYENASSDGMLIQPRPCQPCARCGKVWVDGASGICRGCAGVAEEMERANKETM